MERVVEPEPEATEVEIEFEEEDDELEFIVPWEDEEMEDTSRNRSLYGKTLGGFAAIAALLIVPLVTLPGMVILVLFAEIYLVDWTYTKVNQIRKARSASGAGKKDRMSKADRKNPRASPKDQFVK
jgi:hypothetical protein